MTTSPLTYVINDIQEFVKSCIKSGVHLDLRPNNMLFGRLQPLAVICKWITIHLAYFGVFHTFFPV